MGGNFDWTGIGQGLGDVGQSVVETAERQRLERERKEQEAKEEKRRKAQLRYQAAQQRLALVKHLPEGDPQREAAIDELQRAAGEYFEVPFAVPKKKLKTPAKAVTIRPQRPEEGGLNRFLGQGAPAQTVTIQPPIGRDPKEGEPRAPQAVTAQPATPPQPATQEITVEPAAEKEVFDLGPGEQPEVNVEAVIGRSNDLARGIAAARTPEERRLAVQAYKRWSEFVRAKYPNVAVHLQDPDAIAARFDLEDQQYAAARAAAQGREKWRAELVAARTALDAALKAQNLNILARAIAQYNSLIAAGKQAGYITRGGVDPRQEIAAWQAQLPAEVAARVSPLTGIPLTPHQQKLLDLSIKQKEKSAAPRPGKQPKGSLAPAL